MDYLFHFDLRQVIGIHYQTFYNLVLYESKTFNHGNFPYYPPIKDYLEESIFYRTKSKLSYDRSELLIYWFIEDLIQEELKFLVSDYKVIKSVHKSIPRIQTPLIKIYDIMDTEYYLLDNDNDKYYVCGIDTIDWLDQSETEYLLTKLNGYIMKNLPPKNKEFRVLEN